jgi:serine/threonine protein phosphatase PrpC
MDARFFYFPHFYSKDIINTMKHFSVTFTDFIKFDRKPNEDFYLVSKKLPIFVIADGVTQSHFRSGKHKGEYAFPAAARVAAQIFCYTILDFLEKELEQKKKNPEKLIERAFDLANQKIKELNIAEGIDKKLNYLEYDWFDTVGIAGFIIKDIVYYGSVGDCGLIIFDKENSLKFQTKDQVASYLDKMKKLYKNWEDFSYNKKALIMHRDFRNRQDAKGYGSFSGEKGVRKYYQVAHEKLDSGDLVVFYSDGFLKYFQFPEFIELLRNQDMKGLERFTFKKAKESYQQYGTDRTLVAALI